MRSSTKRKGETVGVLKGRPGQRCGGRASRGRAPLLRWRGAGGVGELGWGPSVLSTRRAPPRVTPDGGALFGPVRHAGATTAAAEARGNRLCGAVHCVLSWGLLPGGLSTPTPLPPPSPQCPGPWLPRGARPVYDRRHGAAAPCGWHSRERQIRLREICGKFAGNCKKKKLRCRHQTSRSLTGQHSCTGDTWGTNTHARGTGTKQSPKTAKNCEIAKNCGTLRNSVQAPQPPPGTSSDYTCPPPPPPLPPQTPPILPQSPDRLVGVWGTCAK